MLSLSRVLDENFGATILVIYTFQPHCLDMGLALFAKYYESEVIGLTKSD